MTKTLSRDYQILSKILNYQNDITEALVRFGYRTTAEVVADKLVTDALALYCAQIGELISKLTDGSKKELTFVDAQVAKLLRNKIDHAYDTINRTVVVTYAMKIGSESSKKIVRDRAKYCMENKRYSNS